MPSSLSAEDFQASLHRLKSQGRGNTVPEIPRLRQGVRSYRSRPERRASGCIKCKRVVKIRDDRRMRGGRLRFGKKASALLKTACANGAASATRSSGKAKNNGRQSVPI